VKVKSYTDRLDPSTMIGNLLILNKSPYIPSHVCSIIALTLLFISVPCLDIYIGWNHLSVISASYDSKSITPSLSALQM